MEFPWGNDPQNLVGFPHRYLRSQEGHPVNLISRDFIKRDALGSVKTHHSSSMMEVFWHQGNGDVFFLICEHDKENLLKTRSSINTWGLNQPLAGRIFI